MGKEKYLLGIDLGTTGVKVVLVNMDGVIKAAVTEEYGLITPRPGWAEQHPSEWWEAASKAIRKILSSKKITGNHVLGVGLTGQMHGSVFLDAQNRVVYPALLWCDQRTQKECDEINETIGKEKVFEITCNPVLTGFQAPKILWLKNNHRKIYDKVKKILLPKDYIRFCLTGEFATDVSDASGTSLFDVKNRTWSKEILERLRIPPESLPRSYESMEITGKITKQAGEITGLLEGTPVVAGAGDQAAGGIGNGIVEEGLVSVTLGTSGVVFAHSDKVFVDPGGRLHTFCHAVTNKWHLMGVMLSAGGSLRWFRDIMKEKSYKTITEEAKKIPPGSEGLFFLPYLTGERTPYPDPDARGVFFGLSLKHTKSHMARAVMEGVTFGLKDTIEIMKEIGLPMGNSFRASGGGGKSSFWCQMQADIFNKNMERLKSEEGPAYGAALLAGTGLKVFPEIEKTCKKFIKRKDTFHPGEKTQKTYERFYPLYVKLYKDLKNSFDILSELM
ncbi:MAG: xylulokinase [Candidatus Omnitrophica bacterium]|nr:xylulokinase [Candidatus Omnitrophota bacterium]